MTDDGQRSSVIGLAATVAALAVVLVVIGLFNHLLFHSVVELFSVAVALAMFMVAWNARRMMENDYLLFLGIAYAFVAALDLVHTVAYKGMGVLAGDASLPTELWIAARLTQALVLAAAPMYLTRRVRLAVMIPALAVVVLGLMASIFHDRLGLPVWLGFPTCYVEGSGLTPFKIYSEYAICAILGCALWLLVRRRRELDETVFRWIALSIVATIGSDLAFTRYVSVYGFSNLVGHLLKILACWLLYKAVIETGVARPYRLVFRDLQRKADELARSNKELEQFAYIASHDLQEPLRAVSGFMQLLADRHAKGLDDRGREYVRLSIEGAQRMSRLVRDLLEYSRAGTRPRQPAPTDMNAVCDRAVANCRSSLSEAGGQVTRDELPTVLGDESQLVQVLQNLIGNAIKFRRAGVAPFVRVSAVRAGGGKGSGLRVMGSDSSNPEPRTHSPESAVSAASTWLFSVCDNGIGIPADQCERVFQIFQRLHSQEEYPGTGIGLAICKKIIERHGGRIWVESKEGEGSTFFFTIPER